MDLPPPRLLAPNIYPHSNHPRTYSVQEHSRSRWIAVNLSYVRDKTSKRELLFYFASACWSASYTSASIRASTLSSSEPLPDATLSASWRLARIACTK